MTMRLFFAVSLFCLFVSLPFKATLAGEPRLLSTYGNWDTYVVFEGSDKVCYMASQAKTPKANYKTRGQPYAIITHRPGDGTRNVFSYLGGDTYKKGSEVNLEIDGQKFALFTQEDTAWAPDSATDGKLSKAIMAGKTMTVKGTSGRGTATTDTLGLDGASAAHDRIDKECR